MEGAVRDLSCLLAFFSVTRRYGVLDRIANALGVEQALAALYDAMRVYQSTCFSEGGPGRGDEEKGCRACDDPHRVLDRVRRRVDELARMVGEGRVDEVLTVLRAAATRALAYAPPTPAGQSQA